MKEEKRLTKKDKTLIYKEENAINLKSEISKRPYCYGKPIEKLAEYENTKLSPAEVEDLKHDQELLNEFVNELKNISKFFEVLNDN